MSRQGELWSGLDTTVRFFGRNEHSLDLKGRVILPSRFRAAFEEGGYLSQYRTRCLALWTPGEFDKQLAEMEAMQDAGPEQLNLARYLAAGSVAVDIDRQGRLPIPKSMRDFARLDGDVLVNGAINRVELWSPALWTEKVLPSEQALTGEVG
ncbi:MAG: transcriptional regulator MraZ [Acidimicrobiaceae bacterium]|jgi:MraZ protein|nr:transcriptional regulator MraZ [Acidimicrobiaceae bacterium]